MAAIASVVAALLAFAGVIAGIVVGIRRWKTERRDTKSAQFAKDRQGAYREIWDAIEELDIALRTKDLTPDEQTKTIQGVNVRMLKGGLYLDTADREALSQYVTELTAYQKLLETSGDDGAKRARRITAVGAPVNMNLHELLAAQERTERMREQLIIRIRGVLIGADEP
jgi:hypothetical protein